MDFIAHKSGVVIEIACIEGEKVLSRNVASFWFRVEKDTTVTFFSQENHEIFNVSNVLTAQRRLCSLVRAVINLGVEDCFMILTDEGKSLVKEVEH